ncbi:MAG: hypothetical protein HY399_08490 [Elusimicrobia bacterium]|nr:hypothetical protein [Elusimicrobiota bacterium]
MKKQVALWSLLLLGLYGPTSSAPAQEQACSTDPEADQYLNSLNNELNQFQEGLADSPNDLKTLTALSKNWEELKNKVREVQEKQANGDCVSPLADQITANTKNTDLNVFYKMEDSLGSLYSVLDKKINGDPPDLTNLPQDWQQLTLEEKSRWGKVFLDHEKILVRIRPTDLVVLVLKGENMKAQKKSKQRTHLDLSAQKLGGVQAKIKNSKDNPRALNAMYDANAAKGTGSSWDRIKNLYPNFSYNPSVGASPPNRNTRSTLATPVVAALSTPAPSTRPPKTPTSASVQAPSNNLWEKAKQASHQDLAKWQSRHEIEAKKAERLMQENCGHGPYGAGGKNSWDCMKGVAGWGFNKFWGGVDVLGMSFTGKGGEKEIGKMALNSFPPTAVPMAINDYRNRPSLANLGFVGLSVVGLGEVGAVARAGKIANEVGDVARATREAKAISGAARGAEEAGQAAHVAGEAAEMAHDAGQAARTAGEVADVAQDAGQAGTSARTAKGAIRYDPRSDPKFRSGDPDYLYKVPLEERAVLRANSQLYHSLQTKIPGFVPINNAELDQLIQKTRAPVWRQEKSVAECLQASAKYSGMKMSPDEFKRMTEGFATSSLARASLGAAPEVLNGNAMVFRRASDRRWILIDTVKNEGVILHPNGDIYGFVSGNPDRSLDHFIREILAYPIPQ